MSNSRDPRETFQRAIAFARRLRSFWDAEARNRDLQLNHNFVTGLRDVRAELSSLGVEQDVAGQQVEALALTIAQLQQEVHRLRGSLASLPVALLATRVGAGAPVAGRDDLAVSLATSYAVRALAALPQGASVLDAGDEPHQVAWSLATLGYAVTALGARGPLVPPPGVEMLSAALADWEPGERKFEGIVTLQGLGERRAGAPLAEVRRLREMAKPDAMLVLSMPAAPDERKLREQLPGWTVDDCTIAEQRPHKGAAKAARRIALVTARAS
jgi:hypothetical protein